MATWELGQHMQVALLSVAGEFTEDNCDTIIEGMMKRIDMTKVHYPINYHYPVDSKGGRGFTYIQPITESFIAFDVWPNFGGAYVVICSCKPFWLKEVVKALHDAGLEVIESKSEGLSLK